MHLHVHLDDLLAAAIHGAGTETGDGTEPGVVTGTGTGVGTGVGAGVGTGGVARVDGLGARALESVRRWLTDLPPGTVIRLHPVLDLTEQVSVDGYEAPDRLRAQIGHRDTCCVFPWCGREGRFDVDHITPYLPLDRGAPPGQTNTSNTARLCRFHHRVKTHPGSHGSWHYRRNPDRSLTWTSPLGRAYTVDHTGTHRHD
jgi:hypothetical protein